MKVLLTGASGFLGQYVLRLLQQSGIPVVAVGRNRPGGWTESLPGSLSGSRCGPRCESRFVPVDLLATDDFASLAKQAGASHLLHLAWVTEHGRYWTSPQNFRWVDASTRLVQAFCETGGQHVVVAGSCAEYLWGDGTCLEDTTPLAPATVYGVAKDATRRLVEALCTQHGVRCAWGRVFFPFGAGEGAARLLPRLIDTLQGRAAPFGVNANACRDFLHVQDVAQGLLALLRTAASGSYNISSGQPLRIGELVCVLAQLLGRDACRVLDQPSERSAEPAALAGNNGKLEALGWRQQLTLLQGLEKTLRDMSVGTPTPRELCHGA
jgi:nucleoside-diphosphate-sugar epimerase